MLKKAFLVLTLFALYTGYKFLPGYLTKTQVKGAIENVLNHKTHVTTDEMLRDKILHIAADASIPLDEENVYINREEGPREHIIEIHLEYPSTISYLGSERTLNNEIYVEGALDVDGAAEAFLAKRQEKVEEYQKLQRQGRKFLRDDLQAQWDECEAKHGKGNCEAIWLP